MGEGWTWDVLSSSWQERYMQLGDWLKTHDGVYPRYMSRALTARSLTETEVNEHQLAQWVDSQRRRGRAALMAHQEGELSRGAMLEGLDNFAWAQKDRDPSEKPAKREKKILKEKKKV